MSEILDKMEKIMESLLISKVETALKIKESKNQYTAIRWDLLSFRFGGNLISFAKEKIFKTIILKDKFIELEAQYY